MLRIADSANAAMQPPQLSLLLADTRGQARGVSDGPHFANFQEN
jgi:hypothetical protein